MADAVTARADERTHSGLVTYAMLFFAVGQLISPIFSAAFGGSFTTADRSGEPPLTPAGYTFSIWFVIEICSVGYAIFAVRRRGMADAGLIDRLAVPLLVVFAGFSIWLIAAEAEPVWSTLVIIVASLSSAMSVCQGRSGQR